MPELAGEDLPMLLASRRTEQGCYEGVLPCVASSLIARKFSNVLWMLRKLCFLQAFWAPSLTPNEHVVLVAKHAAAAQHIVPNEYSQAQTSWQACGACSSHHHPAKGDLQGVPLDQLA